MMSKKSSSLFMIQAYIGGLAVLEGSGNIQNPTRFSKRLFSLREGLDDYACIFCDFHTFEKYELDSHLISSHPEELLTNYRELLKQLPNIPANKYHGIEPIMTIEEFFSDKMEYPFPKHTLTESPCRDMICKSSIFYFCALHPHVKNIDSVVIEHHIKYDFPFVHKLLLTNTPFISK